MAIEYVEVTAGSGTKVACDTVDTDKQVQLIKLALGADGAMDNMVDAGSQLSAASVPVVLASDHADVPITLDGEEVTVNLGATDNAVLDNLYTVLEYVAGALSSYSADSLIVADGGGSLTVDGTVTADLGATDNAVLDDIASKLGTIDADTSTLAAAVSTEMQVDVVGALPAGTNAIGKLAANSGVDIGDVDVTSVVPGVAATNLGKAEDAAHSSGDVGVMALAIRDDTLAAASGTEGDYEPLHTNLNGALYTETIPGAAWSAYEDETGAATDDALVAAPGAGLSLYVTDIVVTNDATAAITIKFIEDTGSAKTQKTGVWKIPASGGIVVNLRTPIKLTANKDWGYTSTGTSNYSVFCAGYTAP